MKRIIRPGSTDQTIDVFIPSTNSQNGEGLTGLVYNSAGLSCYYRRGATGSATQLPLATLATIGAAHADGGFKEVDATNMPGHYRLDLSDAIVAAGVPYVTLQLKGAANMPPINVEIQLEGVSHHQSDVMTESYAADGQQMTMEQCLYMIFAYLFEKTVSGTAMTLKKLDGSTTAGTCALNDASNPTSITKNG